MDIMPILYALILAGAVIYIFTLLPIDPTVKKIGQVIAIVALVLWLLPKLPI